MSDQGQDGGMVQRLASAFTMEEIHGLLVNPAEMQSWLRSAIEVQQERERSALEANWLYSEALGATGRTVGPEVEQKGPELPGYGGCSGIGLEL